MGVFLSIAPTLQYYSKCQRVHTQLKPPSGTSVSRAEEGRDTGISWASPAFLSVSSPRLGWPPSSLRLYLLSPLCPGLDPRGGGQCEGVEEKACGWVWFPAFPEHVGAALYLHPGKGDPCKSPAAPAHSCSTRIGCGAPETFHSKALSVIGAWFLFFPCALVPPWGVGVLC